MSDESESEEWWFEVRPKRVIGNSRRTDRRALLCELESSSASDASTVRLYEVFATHVASSQPICRKSRRSGVDLRELHRCPRSECRSVGRHCVARNSRKARDAEGCPVGREHGRVRSRMTGQSPLGAVKGAQNTDGHFDIDSDVWVTSQPCFPEREDGAVALASRAQESPRKHRSPPRRRNAKQKHRQATRIAW